MKQCKRETFLNATAKAVNSDFKVVSVRATDHDKTERSLTKSGRPGFSCPTKDIAEINVYCRMGTRQEVNNSDDIDTKAHKVNGSTFEAQLK